VVEKDSLGEINRQRAVIAKAQFTLRRQGAVSLAQKLDGDALDFGGGEIAGGIAAPPRHASRQRATIARGSRAARAVPRKGTAFCAKH